MCIRDSTYMDQALASSDLEESYALWQLAQWDGETGVIQEGDIPWVWLVNIDHLYWVRDGLTIAEQKICLLYTSVYRCQHALQRASIHSFPQKPQRNDSLRIPILGRLQGLCIHKTPRYTSRKNGIGIFFLSIHSHQGIYAYSILTSKMLSCYNK